MLQYYMTSISRASERGRALGFPLSLSLPSLRGSCCWGHAANKLLGFALHFASPQVEGSDPPESGVSTAVLNREGWEVSFCLLIVFVMLFLVRVERGRLVPLERLLPTAVPKCGRTSTDGLCQDTCGSFGGPVAWK